MQGTREGDTYALQFAGREIVCEGDSVVVVNVWRDFVEARDEAVLEPIDSYFCSKDPEGVRQEREDVVSTPFVLLQRLDYDNDKQDQVVKAFADVAA